MLWYLGSRCMHRVCLWSPIFWETCCHKITLWLYNLCIWWLSDLWFWLLCHDISVLGLWRFFSWIFHYSLHCWQLGKKNRDTFKLGNLCCRIINFEFCYRWKYGCYRAVFIWIWVQPCCHIMLLIPKWAVFGQKERNLFSCNSDSLSNRLVHNRSPFFAWFIMEGHFLPDAWNQYCCFHFIILLSRIA